MKLLFLTYYSPFHELTGPLAAGAEIAMRCIAEKFAEKGHQVHYMTFGENIRTSELVNNVNVHIFDRAKAQGKNSRFDLRVIGVIIKLLHGFLGYFKTSWCNKIRNRLGELVEQLDYSCWNYKSYLCQIIKRHKIDIVHCFSSVPDSLVATMAANRFNIPLVIRMGGRFWYLKYYSLPEGPKRLKYLEHIKYVFQYTDCLAYNSSVLKSETASMFHELGITSHSHDTVIDIGVNLPTSASAGQEDLSSSIDDSDFVIACVGKFKANSKRQDLLIKATALLKDKINMKIVFAGGGVLQSQMRSLGSELGVSSRLVFLGDISRAQVYQLMKRADLVAHPTDFEGSSKAVAEAMLCNKAILASDIGPLREHITHNSNGYLSKNTTRDFASAIEKLYFDKELREQLGQNAKVYADQEFNPDRNILHYEELFSKLIRERSLAQVMNE